MISQNTEYMALGIYWGLPITVQACLHIRKLVLVQPIPGLHLLRGQPAAVPICSRQIGQSNHSYGYAFPSRAALTNMNPTPAPAILMRTTG
jgi:hypothetical protein